MIVAAFLIAASVFFCVSRNMADSDIWWHLRDAQIQLATHHFLTHDLFSYTAANAAWMNHEWLAELPFYAGFHLARATGLYIVTLVVIELIFLGVLWLAYEQAGVSAAAAFVTLLAILLSTVSFGPRTLLFGWLLLVIELIILARIRRRPRLVWTLPFLFAIWVNTHGSWMIGLVVFALYIVAGYFPFSRGFIENEKLPTATLKTLAACWLTCVAALFVNPYGWRLVFYPFDMAFHQTLNIANVEEWQSLDFHTPRGRILFLCLVLLFVAQLVRHRKWTLFELALVGVGLYSAVTYSRFLFLAAILMAPVLAKSLTSQTAQRKQLSNLVVFASILFVAGLILSRLREAPPITTDNPRFPVKALPYLSNFHPQGNLFNEFTWGGFLIWHERSLPVFVDSRVDIFERNGTFKDYLDITHLKDSLALLDKRQIRYVLFKTDTPLVYLLKATHAWKVDYEDTDTILLERIAN